MRALVTGSGGFVARWLIEHLRDEGDEVIGLPRTELDVTDTDAVLDAISALQPDACYHLAGATHAPTARSNPPTAVRANVIGTVSVLEAIRTAAPHCTVLIAGSAEVYGSPGPDDLPLVEDRPLRPRHPYAATKLAQEALAQSYVVAYGIRAMITRSFNHIGPGQREDFVVPSLVAQASAGGEVHIGNLDVARDFTDVRDVVRAYRLLVLAGEPGTPYNVCSGRATPIREIVAILGELSGGELHVIVDPERVRPDDAPEIFGSPQRLTGRTGWRPQHDIRDTLATMLAAYAQRDGATLGRDASLHQGGN